MTIEYTPVGISCNLKCDYCYQDPMRDAGNINTPIDWSKARSALEKENYNFTVFGGEPLLASMSHLEEVFAFGLDKFGKNGIQTNGALITQAHIEMFKKYNVSVGLSLDGPGEMNSLRCDLGTTQRIHVNLEDLCIARVIPSIIVTVTKQNTSDYAGFVRWMKYLYDLGIRDVNLHILEVDKGRNEYSLSNAENHHFFRFVYLSTRGWKGFVVQPFEDMQRLLLDVNSGVSCIWNACDPLTTPAVHGVGPDGVLSNCGRTNKDGVNWVKTEGESRERYLALYNTPQEFGGCRECRFFFACKGQCPGTAIDGDWRNKTEHCSFWYELFITVEADILWTGRLPITREQGKIDQIVSRFLGGPVRVSTGHSDSPHVDIPHVDTHTDTPHTDWHGDV